MAQPSITSNQIAIDPISGIFYFKNNNGALVSSSLNVLQSSNTQIATEDSFQISGSLVVDGDLTVNGTTITINAESIVVEDKNIELGSGITTNANASGGGITLKGTTDKTFNWIDNTESWTSSENINLASGKVFKINGTEVLSANAYSGSASKWTNARVVTLDGDLSGNVSIDGSANVTLTASIVANSVALGIDTTGDYVAALVAGTGISLANNSGENSTPTISLNASIDELTDVAINNAANGDFFRYNGSTWINDAINLSTDTIGDYVDHLIAGTGITITNNSGEASTPTISLPQSIATNANVTFNQVTSSLVGNVTGNVTGDLTGNVTGNVVGNINGNLVGDTSGNHTGNVIGTASNALVWTNQRKITLDGDVTGNVFIDGSANVTITTTIASNSVTLGVDTTGEYVSNLVAGTGIEITDNGGEGMTPVVRILNSYTTDMLSNISNSAASVSSYADSVSNTAYSNAITYINSRTLDDLSGVTLSNAVVNDVLLYNGSVWINDDLSINKISDVLTSNVLDGQILVYNSSLSKWVNQIVPEAPAGTSLSFTKGNNTDTSFTLFHGLGTSDVVVTVISNITYEVIQTRWSTTNSVGAFSNDHVTVNFTSPPATDEMNITVYGSVQSTAVIISGRLDNLTGDVMIGSPLSGHSLFYNGSRWINRKASIATDMSDVLISGNATGQFLKFNGNTWVNSSIPTINNLDDIGDVTITSVSNGQVLKWNGSAWVNAADNAGTTINSLDDVGDVTITSATNGQFLKWNGTAWVNDSIPTINTLDDVGDVTITSPSNGQFLKWNGAAWVNDAIDLGTDTIGNYMTDVNAGTGIVITHTAAEGSTAIVAVDTTVIQARVADVSDTEIGYLNGVTSAIQTQIDTKAPLASPTFTGTPTLPTGTIATTQTAGDSTTKVATTAFVTTADNLKADLASPALTGIPTAPTASVDTNTTQVATTAYVVGQGYAKLASPTFTGTPTLPTGTIATTQPAGDNSTKVATTAFVSTAVANLVDSAPATLNTLDELAAALGDDANFATSVTTSLSLKAPLASPTFTGTVTLPANTITSSMIVDGTISNVDISSSAAIAYSKLNLSNSITPTDLQQGVARAAFNSTLNLQTASYTLQESDLAKLVIIDSASNATVTVNNILSNGDRIDILRKNLTGEVAFVAGIGVTINGTPGLRLRAQWSGATLVKLEENTWVVLGDLKV